MKLLKLSVQSIVLLYQLLVREQKKKSRLRSVDGQLLLVLAPSCASISKNSLAFNFHIFWRCHLSPTEIGWFEGKCNIPLHLKGNIPYPTTHLLVSLQPARIITCLLPNGSSPPPNTACKLPVGKLS